MGPGLLIVSRFPAPRVVQLALTDRFAPAVVGAVISGSRGLCRLRSLQFARPELFARDPARGLDAIAGAVGFSAFAAGALAQIALGRLTNVQLLRCSVPVLLVGLALFAAGMWTSGVAVFVLGGVVTGAGGGLVFRGALVAAGSTAPSASRAEVLAGFFLGAYIGLSVPVIGLGIATTYAPARDVMLVFVVLVGIAVASSVRAVIRLSLPQSPAVVARTWSTE